MAVVGCGESRGKAESGNTQGIEFRDAGGLASADVKKLSLEQEFELMRKRYGEMQKLMSSVQAVVDTKDWEWNGGDVLPRPGSYDLGGGGASEDVRAQYGRSYYISASRLRFPVGGWGEAEDLEPLQKYFDDQGWKSAQEHKSASRTLMANTVTGFRIEYMVQASGQYALKISSELFWTNDYDSLFDSVALRDKPRPPSKSKPGVFVRFPEWSDPALSQEEWHERREREREAAENGG
ncbi:hypothetical protein [Galactobacter caseinivorans]|uniref:hypothetical protein n=1 Tax=Galactobacter caseinivorans TaxID=2676123 RepID=UPI0011C344E2|nr:hypothetical protein [Galactobacter caseinivorans]